MKDRDVVGQDFYSCSTRCLGVEIDASFRLWGLRKCWEKYSELGDWPSMHPGLSCRASACEPQVAGRFRGSPSA